MVTEEELLKYAKVAEAAREEVQSAEEGGIWEDADKKNKRKGGKGRRDKQAPEHGEAQAAVRKQGRGASRADDVHERGRSGASTEAETGSPNLHRRPPGRCFKCKSPGHAVRDCPLRSSKDNETNKRVPYAAPSSVAEVQSTSEEKPRAATGRLCHLCGRTGHLRADCSLGNVIIPKCLKCANEGHSAAECPFGPSGRDSCRHCGEHGHSVTVCPKKMESQRRCARCGSWDHHSSECPLCGPNEGVCHNWKRPGHESKECSGPVDYAQYQCRKCKQTGHIAAQCPKKGRALPCHKCGKAGHFSRDCPDKSVALTCNECGQAGHIARDCLERKCHECGSVEHQSRQCPTKAVCKACLAVGHCTNQCPEERCYRCSDFGHIRPTCPYPGDRDFDVCWHCKLPSHRRSECPTEASECTLCESTGHVLESCPYRGNGASVHEVVEAASTEESSASCRELPKMEKSTEVVKGGANFAAALRSGIWERFEVNVMADNWGQGGASDVTGSSVGGQETCLEEAEQYEHDGAKEASSGIESGVDTAQLEQLLSPGQVASRELWAEQNSIREQRSSGAASWQEPIGPPQSFSSRPPGLDSQERVSSPDAGPLLYGGESQQSPTSDLPRLGRIIGRPLSAHSPSCGPSPALAVHALRDLQRTPSSLDSFPQRNSSGSYDLRKGLATRDDSATEIPCREDSGVSRLTDCLEVPRGSSNGLDCLSSQSDAAVEDYVGEFDEERVNRLMASLEDRAACEENASWHPNSGLPDENLPGDDIFEPSADVVLVKQRLDADADQDTEGATNEEQASRGKSISRGVHSDPLNAADAAWKPTASRPVLTAPESIGLPQSGGQENRGQAAWRPVQGVRVTRKQAPGKSAKAPPPGFQLRSELSSSPPPVDKLPRPPPGFFQPSYPPAQANLPTESPAGGLPNANLAAPTPYGNSSSRPPSSIYEAFSPLSTEDPVFKDAPRELASSGPFAFGHPLRPVGLSKEHRSQDEIYGQQSAFAGESSANFPTTAPEVWQGLSQRREWSGQPLPDETDRSDVHSAVSEPSLPPPPHEVLRRLLPQTAAALHPPLVKSPLGAHMQQQASGDPSSFGPSGRNSQLQQPPASFYPSNPQWAPQPAEGPPFLRLADASPSWSSPDPAANSLQSFGYQMPDERQSDFRGSHPSLPSFSLNTAPPRAPPLASPQTPPHILALRAKVQQAQNAAFQGGAMPPSSSPLQTPQFANGYYSVSEGSNESHSQWRRHVPSPAPSLIGGSLSSTSEQSVYHSTGWVPQQDQPSERCVSQNGGYHNQTLEEMRALFPREQTPYGAPDARGPVANGQVSQSQRKSAYNPMQWQKEKARQVSSDPDKDLERLLRENVLVSAQQPEGADSHWSSKENGDVTPLADVRERYAVPAAEAVPRGEDQFEADLQAAMNLSLEEYKSQEASDLLEVRRTSWPALRAAGKQEVVGKGLANRTGEYNCFLNVVIQSLWHLVPFRQSIASQPWPKRMLPREQPSSRHVAVLRGLGQIFRSLSADDGKPTAVDPSALRTALHDAHAGSDLFQIEEMNDASEVLLSIFSCLHESLLLLAPSPTAAKLGNGLLPTPNHYHAPRSKALKTTDVCSGSCFVHDLFGLDMQEYTHCPACHEKTHTLHYQQFFHLVNCSALCEATAQSPALSFAPLLSEVLTNSTPLRPCDKDEGGCGALLPTSHVLDKAPKLFTVVLVWGSAQASQEQVRSVVSAIGTRICVSDIFPNLTDMSEHALRCLVCYYGLHYFAFAFSTKAQQWIYLDDSNVKVVGTWDKVVEQCTTGRLQPSVLFYEAQ